jgi:hypothetical protein
VVVFAVAGSGALDTRELLAHRIAASLAAGTAMLSFALVIVIVLIVRPAQRVYRT